MSLFEDWIDPRHRSKEARTELARWFATRPSTPMFLEGILVGEKAARLQEALTGVTWTRSFTISTSPTETTDVTAAEFKSFAPSDRFGIQEFFDSTNLAAGGARVDLLLDFFALVTRCPDFRAWIGSIVERPVAERFTCELSRYSRGTYLREHDDLHDPRIIGVNFYISGIPMGEPGGRLGYKNEAGERFVVTPKANSLSLFPVREGCMHWVTEWSGDEPGRTTASLSYRPAA